MSMQNLTAALNDEKLTELFSNCDYKCFLDQGGVDANALREIQELSQTEFDALSTDQVRAGRHGLGERKSSCLICVSQKRTLCIP